MRPRWVLTGLAALTLVGAMTAPAAGQAAATQASAVEWVGADPVHLVYDPGTRYLNDHTVIKAPDGTWHLFGITAQRAPDGQFPDGGLEVNIAHATAPALAGPWTTQPYALTVDPDYFGEAHLWAPHVIADNGTYYMFYAAGGNGAAMNLATSTDLNHWTRIPSGPLFRGIAARDPYVVRIGDQWVMYYCEINGADHHHVVAYRTSTDLVHWSGQSIAFTDPSMDSNAPSNTESPFVVRHNGSWYLFIGPRGGYVGTDVFRSSDPLHFDLADYAGHVPVHAAEVVEDGGTWWATGAGSFEHGLYLAKLRWQATPPLWPSTANPSSTVDARHRLQLFALGAGHTVLRAVETAPDSGNFGAWQPFGVAGTVPSVVTDRAGRLEVLAPNADGTALLRRVQTDPATDAWGAWTTFGPAVGAPPATGKYPDGRLAVFALGPGGNAINVRVQTGTDTWSDWQQFGGPAGAPPVVGTNADGRLEVFAVGPGGAYVAHRWQNTPGGDWSAWDGGFGGPAAAVAPSVGNDADGRLEVFIPHPVGTGTAQRVQAVPSGGWFDWRQLSGTWPDASPAVRRDTDGRLETFFLSPGGDYLARKAQASPNGTWSPEQRIDDGFPAGQVACTPAVTAEADGRLVLLALTPNGALQRRTQSAPSSSTWTPWKPLGGTALAIPSCGGAT
ncbi:glycosyl hydrolase family 32 [Labedaea rhizosphaerae]|uniref:Glycosyl hydrolase family 32 n=1 Tax=Labedaea rhizosphaerae TaxID=598644 RepID=A0A4R6S6F3_LABRH|nr:glycosyl hydrolase family 32 [Labedaea rhizosphaerae]TDP94894.1 glycosyl hydrolase family 32 [Labedaea rhizosphaerae]